MQADGRPHDSHGVEDTGRRPGESDWCKESGDPLYFAFSMSREGGNGIGEMKNEQPKKKRKGKKETSLAVQWFSPFPVHWLQV